MKKALILKGRIDSANAAAIDEELTDAVSDPLVTEIELDAKELTYISSAGLRILMKLRKMHPVSVINVSPDVYEIMAVTGFTQLLDVHRRLREVSHEGCELIGRGGNGSVYRLDDETILKLYNEGTTLEKIDLEKKYATAAFTAGLPCAIAYDTVRSGNQYGIVFELLDAVTVGRAADRDPDRIPELGKAMGHLLRQLHSTETPEGVLPKMTEKAGAWIDYLEDTYLSHGDADLMRSVLEAVPEKNTLVHLDFHEGNVMIQGNELLLIDLDDICTGNPLYDLIGHYTGHVLGAASAPDSIRLSMGMSADAALKMNRYTLEAYLGTTDLTAHEQSMKLLSMFYMLLYLAKGKDSRNLTPERAQGMLLQILPQFRQLAPVIRETVKRY